jgi:beta-glucanase (GH16 family)
MHQQRRARHFRPIHGFLVVLFLITLAVAAPRPSTAQTTNLALNRPVTTSSIEGAGFEGSRAVDGSGATRWASLEGVDPQWIRIDLGSTATVSRVRLSWEAAYARGYRVEISADSSAWTPLYTTSSGDGGIDDLTVSGSGRYLRIYGTVRGTAWGYSLFEIAVYGSTTTPPTATPRPTATPNPTATPSGSWNLVWSDEFNQAAVNTNNWKFIVNGEGGGNNERQYYTNGQNASIVSDAGAEDSKALLIEARKENPAGYQCWYGACQYTSARLVTQGKKSWQYGRIEARMKLPAGNGIWPAFWMMGNSGNWPASGEIDIMELVGGTQCGSECGDNHTHGYMWWSENGDRSDGAQAKNLPSGKYSDAYHVFGVEWDAQQIRWTIDGQPLIRADNGQPLALSVTGAGKTEFHQPFYILLNIAVGGDWPLDPPSSTAFPQRMYIDWVRVYQQ